MNYNVGKSRRISMVGGELVVQACKAQTNCPDRGTSSAWHTAVSPSCREDSRPHRVVLELTAIGIVLQHGHYLVCLNKKEILSD